MTQAITTILAAIAATGATESSDPIRDYIVDLEQRVTDLEAAQTTVDAATAPLAAQIVDLQGQVQTLSYSNQTAIDDATNPLKEQIKGLTQQLADAEANFAAKEASDIGSATAPLIAEVARLNGILDAIRAQLP